MLPTISSDIGNAPNSLLNICLKYIVKDLRSICYVDLYTKDYKLWAGLAFPEELCERIFHVYQLVGHHITDQFVHIFENNFTTRLKRICIHNSDVTDDGMKVLLRHQLVELDISHCSKVTEGTLNLINKYSNNLESLSLGEQVNILPISLYPEGNHSEKRSVYLQNGYILKAPNLKRLTVKSFNVDGEPLYFPLLLTSLNKLTHLDLSECSDLGYLIYLCDLHNLTSLVLYNVPGLQEAIGSICKLTNLRHLDISQSIEKYGMFKNENKVLARIVDCLPHLVSLDISGTNLAGTGVAEASEKSNTEKLKLPEDDSPLKTDIPGLSSRVNNPLEFLGLYKTLYRACSRHDIPARKISGDANEDQILTAAVSYIDRPDVLQRVINDLYHLFRFEICNNINLSLSIVLEAMDKHLEEKHIQISGSATLFYLVKGKDKNALDTDVKRKIICSLINGMTSHPRDDTLMRNGCLTLCQFKIPEDVLFDYKRLVLILLHIVSEMDQESFVQRIGIYLLNSLACQVDGFQKKLIGELGTIDKMLALIEDRLSRKVCDDVLEVAWSTMWNVTDETPINCQRFLNGNGMEYFLGCLSKFPNKEELLRNMMGLLGNVAEVKFLRPQLMCQKFVTVFADLLDSQSDGIEVSYNAAGVISHMASDGPEAWTLIKPRRKEVLKRMVSAIERWNLTSERNINYRSFEPILHLAKVFHTPECQHWSVWALANLTKVYPMKYCVLVESEGGLEILDELIASSTPYTRIKDLAFMVKRNCKLFESQSTTYENLPLDG